MKVPQPRRGTMPGECQECGFEHAGIGCVDAAVMKNHHRHVVEVTLDRVWQLPGEWPVGDVREFCGDEMGNGHGWGFSVRLHPGPGFPGLPSTIFIGAHVESEPFRTEEIDGEVFNEPNMNYGISSELIKAAVEYAAAERRRLAGSVDSQFTTDPAKGSCDD